jgi:phosphoribosylglycinamide formyltransferase 2
MKMNSSHMAHGFEVINMFDGEALDRIVAKTNLFIVRLKPFVLNFYDYEKQGITVVPSESGKFHNEPKSHP